MRAWTVGHFGHYRESLRFEEVPAPSLEPGTVVIRTHAIGLNFPDLLMIAGRYQVRPPRPFVPGFETAGEVVASSDEARVPVGTRVTCMDDYGGFAELRRTSIERALPIPQALSYPEAAAFSVAFQTSWFALGHRAGLRRGEVLLVLGAAGGVGSAAVQLGRQMGATVIAVVGGAEKADVCRRLGSDHVLDHQREDVVEGVRRLTAGRGADVVFDPVGGDLFDASLRCLAWEGRLVSVGFASGRIPELALNRVLLKNISILGLFWGGYWRQDPELIHRAHAHLMGLATSGRVRPLLWDRLPWTRLPEGLSAIEERKTWGKVVLELESA